MPPLGVAHAVFGVPATVTPVDGAPILTTALYHRQATTPPAVGALGRAGAAVDLRDAFSIPRALVLALPVGSTILASRDGLEPPRAWRVDRVDDRTPDEYRVIVSPVPEP